MTTQTITLSTPDLKSGDIIVGSSMHMGGVRIEVRGVGAATNHGGYDTYHSIHTDVLGTFQATVSKTWVVEREVTPEPFRVGTVLHDTDNDQNFIRTENGFIYGDGSRYNNPDSDEFFRGDIARGGSKIVFEPEA